MTTAGPTAARKFWRKTSTTSMTSTMDFTKVRYTLRHGDGNEVRRVERHGPAHVGREILGQFFHGAADVGGGFKGVGVGQLVDGDERRVVPADLGLCPVGLRPHFDFAHVAQPDYLVAGQRLDDDVAEWACPTVPVSGVNATKMAGKQQSKGYRSKHIGRNNPQHAHSHLG